MAVEKRCQKCGTPVAADAIFCSRCGVDVTVVQSSDAPTLEMPAAGAAPVKVKSTLRQTLRDATVGEYEVLEELGKGGMATVFLAQDISLDRKVAIKVMSPHLLEGEGMAERFKLEARTAAQLSHPHIIPIYAVRETETTLFFVMKYVEGRTLDEIIKRMTGPMPIPMIKDVLAKVGAALGYAHRRNVIHRDVKPGNIMIDGEGTPIVTDFGIAKVTEKKGLTMTGTTIGTPAYMSPEQCEAKQVTGASDQYSLGVVAWEMLTGRTPFTGDSAVTTMYKHCHEPLPPLKDFRPDCPSELVDVVTRMLAKNPADRWPSLEAAVKKLDVTGTISALDPIRGQLLELASQPQGRELIAKLSTPRSPIPGVAKTVVATPAQLAALPGKKRAPALAAAAVVVLALGAGALAMLRPWERGGEAPPVGGGEVLTPAEAGADQPTTPAPVTSPGDGTQADAGGGSTSPPADDPPAAVNTSAVTPPPPVTAPTTSQRPVPTIASVRIDGVRGELEPGDELGLSATALDASGQAMQGPAVRWSSSNEAVGRVSGDGSFTALAAGSVTITAQVGSVTARETIEVGGPSVRSVTIDRSSLSLTAGERAQLGATAVGRNGAPLSTSVSWRSGNTAVASVDERGQVVAAGPGQTTITASAGGQSAIVSVAVAAAPVEAREAIPELIAAYARALASRDIAQVRQAYPGMTQQQETQLRAALPNLSTATLSVEGIDEQGDVATAMVRGQYVFTFDGRPQQTPVTFRATFERAGVGWRMTRTEDAR